MYVHVYGIFMTKQSPLCASAHWLCPCLCWHTLADGAQRGFLCLQKNLHCNRRCCSGTLAPQLWAAIMVTLLMPWTPAERVEEVISWMCSNLSAWHQTSHLMRLFWKVLDSLLDSGASSVKWCYIVCRPVIISPTMSPGLSDWWSLKTQKYLCAKVQHDSAHEKQ